MADKSLLDYAFDVLANTKEPIAFRDLFNEVLKLSGLELTEDELRVRISRFYSQLTLDGRFVVLTDNYWDLRVRHSYDEVHIDMEDAYSDDDDSEEEVDAEEQKYLNEELGEVVEEDDDSDSDDLDFDKPKADADGGDEF